MMELTYCIYRFIGISKRDLLTLRNKRKTKAFDWIKEMQMGQKVVAVESKFRLELF